MQNEKVPEWAYKRADELMGDYLHPYSAFARYIAEHEEPPVDPLRAAMDEAYDEGERYGWSDEANRQNFVDAVRRNLAKRGIGLACKEDSHAG
jgi:hypothetical protein